MLKLALNILLGAIISSFSLQVFAVEPLRIGVEKGDFYPFFIMKKGNYRGFSRELFDLYAQEKGQRITYTAATVGKLTEKFVSGDVAFKFPDNPVWAKHKKSTVKVLYSLPVVNFTDGLMVMSENRGRPLSAIKTVGVIRGFTPFPILSQINSGAIKLKEYTHTPIIVKKLMAGEVDAIYVNIEVAGHIITEKMEGADQVVFDSQLPHAADSYYLSTISRPETIESFNDFLTQNQSQISELKHKYGLH